MAAFSIPRVSKRASTCSGVEKEYTGGSFRYAWQWMSMNMSFSL